MKKSERVKEKIISVTMDLIQAGNGNVGQITTRDIAKQAEVGIGLINYHFTSKEELIELCVQRIIGEVISSFKPALSDQMHPCERLKTVSKMVADFLAANPSVSRISILGDYHNPGTMDNTMKTIMGFSFSLQKSTLPEAKKKLLLFSFTSILQAAFLRKDISRETLGIDFNNKADRDRLIDLTIDTLFQEEKK